MSHPVWTDEQMAALRKHWAEGLSAALIAEAMGVTRNSVIGKVHRMRLPPRTTLDRKPAVSGWHLYRQRHGALPRKELPRADWGKRRELLAEIHSRKGTVHEAAAAFGVSVNHTYAIATQCGMPFVGPARPAGGQKPKRAPRDRKSIKGVSQAPWRPPVAVDALTYEAERRSNGAMRFIDMPNARMSFLCHWPLAGEEGAHGIWCCAPIAAGAVYCAHHRARGSTPYRSRKLEAAE